MFYEGDIESGITVAMQGSKLVCCFVRDNDQESVTWESDYLKDASVRSLLSEKAVLLRIEARSREASFLAAIYPLPKTPTLVIIQNKQLKEYITSGISKLEFLKRIKAALDDGSAIPGPLNPGGISTPISVAERGQLAAPTDGSGDPIQEQSGAIRELLQERRVRMEAKKKEQDEKNTAERAAKAPKMKGFADVVDPPDPRRAAASKYALLRKEMQRKARDEHARVLMRVEDDKAERRTREALRKEQMNAVMELGRPEGPNTAPLMWLDQHVTGEVPRCALQIRLFDGTTIKSRFSPQSTLQENVRNWIADQQLVGDAPYTFKQILTPQQNRAITTSEEEKSLQSIGLTPSCTLILVPVKDYTTAYAEGMGSCFSTATRLGLWILSSGFSLVTGTFRRLLEYGQGTARDTSQSSIEPTSNVKTFQDERDPSENEQFYNGNALNFEPRWSDEE